MRKLGIFVTEHALDRIKERLGLSNKAAERMAEVAYRDGIEHSETIGRLNKYIAGLTYAHMKKGTCIRIYGEVVYCFVREKTRRKEKVTLLTAWNIPNALKKNVLSLQKRKKEEPGHEGEAAEEEKGTRADGGDACGNGRDIVEGSEVH